ncbi:MAG: F420-dependent NADP oxidoreductase [Bacteroidales bacterium]
MAAFNISFVGAGNVAESLARGLAAAGHRIVSVTSRNGENARVLAAAAGAEWRHDLSVPAECEVVIISVTDSAVAGVAASLVVPEGTVIAHTAGSVPLDALGRKSGAGVFYPLQTFTKGFPPDLKKVPFFIEATDSRTLQILRELGESIGTGVWECDSVARKQLHVAAVFTNNFSNYMMTVGDSVAASAGIDAKLLRPLMEETVRKALRTGPEAAQTGPAVRHDTGTMESHIDLLSFSPQYQKLYRLVSKMISGHYRKGKK